MKKDDMLEITIEDISSDGSGVGKADGFALFVKDTIPGDQVKVKIMKMKKRYGYARLMEILVPSPDRIQAPCPVARQCGGCQIQQMSYERQLTFKENKVCNNLRRLGGLDLSAMEVEPICGMEEPFHYRNKAQFPIGRDKNGKIIAGFYAGRTHSIIANTDCLLGAEENEAILNEVISWMEVCKVEPYDEKTGKRLIKNVLGKTQAEVKEKLAKAVAEAETVDVRRADEYTLGTWLQTWYELYAKPHLRFSTAEYYRRGIELHITPRIGDIPLKKLTGRDLQWLYKDLQEHGRLREAQKGKQPGLSDSTIRGIHTMLHNALDRAVKERLIMRNPANDCIPPKIPKHEMKILPPEQIKSYLTAADQRGVLPMFYLELISGLRKGELVALQWSDLDIENKTISVSKQAGRNNAGEPDITRPKTENSIRKISIPQDAVDLLIAEHQKHPSNPWMFPSPKTGEMYHPDSVVNIHKKILKDAGLEHLRFHDLRHTFATLALQNGVDVKTVSSMLGHFDAGFTLRTYTHVTRQMQESTAEKMGNFMAQVM